MEIEGLRQLARALGVECQWHHSKIALVRAIQRRQGEPSCFATDRLFNCSDADCSWRTDCHKPIAEWLR